MLGKGLRLRSLTMNERAVGRGETARHTGRERDPGREGGDKMRIEPLDAMYKVYTTSFHCPPGVCTCPDLFCSVSCHFSSWLLSVQPKKPESGHPGHFLPRGLPALLGSQQPSAGMTSPQAGKQHSTPVYPGPEKGRSRGTLSMPAQ